MTNDITQKKHLHILNKFTHNDLNILITTDITTHNLHIPTITHIFNYNLPDNYKNYIHHINRTNHTNTNNHSINLTYKKYTLNLPTIETYINHSIPINKYNPNTLITDLPKPLHLTHPHTNNNPHHTDTPHNRRRSN